MTYNNKWIQHEINYKGIRNKIRGDFLLTKTMREDLSVKAERAVLVSLHSPDNNEDFDDLHELQALAETAGAKIVAKLVQKRPKIDAAYYLGRGKINQLAGLAKKHKAQVVIFDNDLTPGQIRNIEEIVGCKVLDRSELILDIFATHARSKQARLQVELAQLQYTYPRLRHMWTHLERIAGAAGGSGAGVVGGIGTRGPGEKQIEVDRRLVRKRIDVLKRELKKIDERKLREVSSRANQFTVCLVGYTNAGKSTLMNALTGAGVYVEDKLFATLDTRTRRWHLGQGRTALLSDTVGFVRNLPHHLIASFKATLEEAINADLLLHVVDASNPKAEYQISTVLSVLKELSCDEKNIVTVFNKIDCLEEPDATLKVLRKYCPSGIAVSAALKKGLDELTERVNWYYHKPAIHLTLTIDCDAGKLFSFLKTHARIHSTEFFDSKANVELTISTNLLGPLRQYSDKFSIINSSDPQAIEELTISN